MSIGNASNRNLWYRGLGRVLLVCTAFQACVMCPDAVAQETAPPAVEAPPVTVEGVEENIRVITENAAMDESTKTNLLALYNRALDQARIAEEHRARAEQLEEQIRLAPGQAEELQTSNALPLPDVTLEPELSLVEYEQQLIEAQSALEAARQQVTTLQTESDRRSERRRELTDLQTQTNSQLQELLAQTESTPPEAESPEMTLARRTLFRASRAALELKLAAYDAELRNFDIRRSLNLVSLRSDGAARERRILEDRVNALDTLVVEERQRVAQRTATDAAQAAEDIVIPGASTLPPDDPTRLWIEAQLEENRQLAVSRTGDDGVPARITAAKTTLESLTQKLGTLTTEFEDLQTMVDKARSSTGVGALLGSHRRTLPEVRQHQRNMRLRGEKLTETEIRQTELNFRRRPLSDIDGLLRDRLGDLASKMSEPAYKGLQDFVRSALNDQKKIVDQLIADYSELSEVLINANLREQEIVDQANQFRTYIDERVFWVRSTGTFGLGELRVIHEPIRWLLSTHLWEDELSRLGNHVRRYPAANIVLALVFVILFAIQGLLRKRIHELGEEASNSMCTSYVCTLRAFVLTLVVAGVWSAFLAAVAWRLARGSEPTDYTRSIVEGLLNVSLFLFIVDLFRQVARPHGLGSAHFGWPEKLLKNWRRHVVWFGAVSVPLVFISVALRWHGQEEWTSSLVRFLFMVNMAVIAALGHVVLRSNGVLGKARSGGLVPRNPMYGRWAHALALLVPGTLLVLAFIGYQYTAAQLGWRLFITLCVGLGLLLVRGMTSRWLTLAHRRIAIAQYRERIKTKAAKTTDAPQVEEEKLDLSKTVIQTSRLTNSALLLTFAVAVFFVWSGVLPAFAMLDDIRFAESTSLDPDGNEVHSYISLAMIVSAALIGLITVAAARNIPGILEVVLHKRFALQAGERYALTTIARYIIVIAGVMFAADTIGFGWSKLQWLVAALSLGIGFGLQEIVANFISGIILLFERPIRVGDTVTIGSVSGTVSRIRMRATTITDWDLKELVVPNKEFITGQLINWSLTDKVLRVIIPVGVAYGSDTKNVVATLHKVAEDSPMARAEPKPTVVFMGFGASSLDFELRVYCNSIEDYIPTRHQIHMAVDQAFREQKIEIAFPQRDLHIRSIKDIVRISEDRSDDDPARFADAERESSL